MAGDVTIAEITSTANPRIQAAARLRDRSEREARGLTLVDGLREIDRAIEAGASVVEAFVDAERAGTLGGLLGRLEGLGARVTAVSERVIGRLAYGERSEGLVAVVRAPRIGLDRLVLPPDALVTVVEGVEKPGNLGAVLRSVDGAGGHALVAADPGTDLFNPNVIRASLGTVFSVPVAAASVAETLAWLRTVGVRMIAAKVDAATDYTAVDLRGPLAIVLGSEAEGLSDAWLADDVDGVRLPMLGVADSLNVSIAAAILLYEARRQRGSDGERNVGPSRADRSAAG